NRVAIELCTDWMKQSLPWQQSIALLAVPAYVFSTVHPENMTPWSFALGATTGLTLALLMVGIALGWRCSRRAVWLLSLALIVVPMGVLVTPDLLFGGQRAFSPRFHFPCYVGVTLATVHFLMGWLDSSSHRLRRLGQAAAVFLLAVGIATCTTIWNA